MDRKAIRGNDDEFPVLPENPGFSGQIQAIDRIMKHIADIESNPMDDD